MKRYRFFIYLEFLLLSAFSQILTPEYAVETALKNNLNLIVSKNNAEIASISYSRGNAGMLPAINLSGASNFSQNNTRQNLLSGTVVDRKGAISTGVSSAINLNWTLFDGMKMFFTYKKLQEEKNLSENKFKSDIETLVSQVMLNYFTLVKTKQLIKSFGYIIDLYNSRLEIAEFKWKNGSVSKLDFLQAKVDLNEQQLNLLNFKNEEENLKIALNQLLSRAPETTFEVIDSIPVTYFPSLEELRTSYVKQNKQLKIQEINIQISRMSLNEIRSLYFPKISFGSGYNFNRNENQAGFILLNQNLGFNAGITASWNIFNSGNTNRLYKAGKIESTNSELLFNALKLGIEAEILRSFLRFKNNREILLLEEKNLSLAKENVEIAMESFRLGAINSVGVKEAQRSYQDAVQRTMSTRLEIKKNEIDLMRLNGILIK